MRYLLLAALLLAAACSGPTGSSPPAEESVRPYSHARDWSWVAGKLVYSGLEGGFWELHFVPPGEEPRDPYGGRFVLQGAPPEGLEDGALVVVRGGVSEEQVGIQMAGPFYRVDSLEPLE